MSCYLWSISDLSISFCRLHSWKGLKTLQSWPMKEIMTAGWIYFSQLPYKSQFTFKLKSISIMKYGSCPKTILFLQRSLKSTTSSSVRKTFTSFIKMNIFSEYYSPLEIKRLNIHPWCFDWGSGWGHVLLLVSFIKMDGARWPGNTVLFFALPISVHLSLSLCLSASVPVLFCLCTSIACKIYVSLSIPSFGKPEGRGNWTDL